MFTSKTFSTEELLKLKEELTPVEKWTIAETLALINSYNNRRHLLAETKLKKVLWETIRNDLLEEGIHKTSFHIANKWKNLVRTYKHVNQNNRKGKSTRFLYIKEMSSIFEDDEDPLAESPEDLPEVPYESVALEFSENNLEEMNTFIDNSVDGTSELVAKKNVGTSSRTMINLKMKYFKRKIAEIDERKEERERYLHMLLEDKTCRREREEKRLKLREKELQIEERKVVALEQYLILRAEKTLE